MTIWEFFRPIVKPYKWHYIMMFQIPMVAVAFHVLNSYAIKLIVDSGVNNNLTIQELIYPIAIFIGIATFQEIVCRSGHWAFNKSQPYIRGEIVSRSYDYVQNHSYSFFQNTPSGSIASKIKGIASGYDNIFEYIWFKLTNPFVMCIFGTLSLAFINLHLAILVFAWCLVFFFVGFKMALKLSKLSQISNEAKHKAIGMIADNITNIFTIFSFTSRRRELNKIKNFTCGEVANLDYQTMFYDFKFACVGALLFIGMSSSVLIYAGYLRYINEITVGSFTYIITILYKIIYDIWTLSAQVGSFLNKLGDFKSSFSIMQIEQCKIDKNDAMELII